MTFLHETCTAKGGMLSASGQGKRLDRKARRGKKKKEHSHEQL